MINIYSLRDGNGLSPRIGRGEEASIFFAIRKQDKRLQI
jgi:hypothetical protein